MAKTLEANSIAVALNDWHRENRNAIKTVGTAEDEAYNRSYLEFLDNLYTTHGRRGRNPDEEIWMRHVINKIKEIEGGLPEKLRIKRAEALAKNKKAMDKQFKQSSAKPTFMHRLGRIYGKLFPQKNTTKAVYFAQQMVEGFKIDARNISRKIAGSNNDDQKAVQSYDHLVKWLIEAGYKSFIPELEKAVVKGEASFQLKARNTIGSDLVTQQLNFIRSGNQITLKNIVASVMDKDHPGRFKTLSLPFDRNNTFSRKEMNKLIRGGTVCKLELDDMKNPVKKLYSINSNDLALNRKITQVQNYVADAREVKNVVDSLPYATALSAENKAELAEKLISGEKVSVILQQGDVKMKVGLQVGWHGSVKYTDVNNRPITYQEIKKHLNPPKNITENVNQGQRKAKNIKKLSAA